MDSYLRTDGMELRLVFLFLLPNRSFFDKARLDNPYQLQKAYLLRYGLQLHLITLKQNKCYKNILIKLLLTVWVQTVLIHDFKHRKQKQ